MAGRSHPTDPTAPIRKKALDYPEVLEGTSCNQSSFKIKKTSFLFIGPGAQGQGFKAMFNLSDSLAQAASLAVGEPERFQVGNGGWVTARFTKEVPLPKTLWSKWLAESYALSCGSGTKPKKKSAERRKPS